ncbi:partitioning defective 3 homolog, partial [Limulus polyphemus]|uniref:Partitioning defective 3 homolog n=1 Tax=Limulus polyphemus TaxID=6850 RepID=A0ABM1TQN8_LIMPO
MWITIIAIYEEQGSPFLPHNGGDGTSASSMGTESPDIFRCKENPHHKLKEFYSENDVVITACDISSGLTPLYVRRESEPALNRLLSDVSNVDSTKRWSAAVTMGTEACGILKPLKMQDGRKEPLSELGTSTDQSRDRCIDSLHGSEDRQDSIILKSESGPLGIHVISDYDLHGRGMGIVVQGIEPGGRIDQDGRLCVGDRIVAINGKSLLHISFQKAQELFKDALKEPEIRIQLSKSSVQRNIETPLLPFYPNSVVCREFSRNEDETTDLVERQKQESLKTKVSSVKTTEKIPPSVRLNQKITPLTSNTRKIGRKIPIQLMKGPFSFGFSITTRDNPAGGNCPIYVKNILPKGAAVQDGRLKPGDRILERQKNDGMHNFEINKEIERSGNRLGFSHPSKYSHYVNYKEIQQHLQEFRQNKLQNHPHQKQRGKSSIEQKVRPVSNYFGYGSKQVLHQQSSNQQSNESDTKSLPHHSK